MCIRDRYHSRRVSTLRPVSASNNSCVGVGSRGVSRPRSAPPKSTKRGYEAHLRNSPRARDSMKGKVEVAAKCGDRETQRLRKQVHMRELELEKAREELNLLREEVRPTTGSASLSLG
eukprot:TRINITY_DN3710_c0_g1_i14.p1 TRINITY_DN3710_c0_g1~~TRINITY_DN3710_c0_g1_i14.p1  ORF type:complete len:133 (-),score=17.99 TRINITY_DN3710_c0_g1_i14:617-970(-)